MVARDGDDRRATVMIAVSKEGWSRMGGHGGVGDDLKC